MLKICIYMYMFYGDLLILKLFMELSLIYICSIDIWSSWYDILIIIFLNIEFLVFNFINLKVLFLFNYMELRSCYVFYKVFKSCCF